MINNIFVFPVQSAVQTQGPGDPTPANPVVSPFESSTLWIDDEQIWWLGANF